jgi:hypothetical protein
LKLLSITPTVGVITWGAVKVGNIDNYRLYYTDAKGATIQPAKPGKDAIVATLMTMTAGTAFEVNIVTVYGIRESAVSKFKLTSRKLK